MKKRKLQYQLFSDDTDLNWCQVFFCDVVPRSPYITEKIALCNVGLHGSICPVNASARFYVKMD